MRRSPSAEFLSLCSRSSSWSTACATVLRAMSRSSRRMSRRSKASHPRPETADQRYVDSPVHDVHVSVLRIPRRAGGVLAPGRDADRRDVYRRVADRHHSENVRWNGQRGAARYSVLPAGRRADELGQRRAARGEPVAEPGWTYPRRPVPGRYCFQHVLLGDVGLHDRRRCGDQPRIGRADEAGGLQPPLHCRDHRRSLDHRGARAAEHHGGGVWRDRQCLDRGLVYGRRRAGADDRRRIDDILFLLWADGHDPAPRAFRRSRSCVQVCFVAIDDSRYLAGRHSDRFLHAHRSRSCRSRLDHRRGDPGAGARPYQAFAVGFLSRGAHFLAAADHDRRGQRVRLVVAYLRGALVIAEWIGDLAGNNPQATMLLLVLLFTIIGDFIEPVPTIIIFMPLVNALTQAADINPVHMGVVLIATLAFGLITPPYGLVLLMASKFIGVRFSQALRAALPIYVVFLGTIAFAIYFPKVVLWLPKQVIPESVGCFKNPGGAGHICPP